MNWSRSFAVLVLFVATPAVAQPYPQPYPAEPYYSGVISPREVMRVVAGMGLQPMSEPRLRGNVWIVRGAGREGTIVRVMVDAHNGRVVDMRAVRGPGPYGPGAEPGPYQPDPRYVMREPNYPPDARAYPAPRPGEVYQAEPPYPGQNGAAVPDDDDDDNYGQPVPQPRGYVPPHSSYPSTDTPRVSSTPETRRLAAKPPAVPLPKARPDGIKSDTMDAAKKDDGKKDEAGKDEPKKEDVKQEQAAAPLTSPKDPETTASIAAAHNKMPTPDAQPKKQELPPVQPLD